MLKRWLCLLTAAILALGVFAASGAAETYQKLQRGDYSDDVLRMQKALISLGYSLTADGKYGASTEAVVRIFQKAQGLKVDGVAGQATLETLYSLSGASAGPTAPAPTIVTQPAADGTYIKLKYGATGPAVKNLQLALISLGYSITADGVYGAQTRSAVISFQRTYGLSADGIAGAATQKKLYEIASGITPTSHPTATPTPAPTATGSQGYPVYSTARVKTSGGGLNLRAFASETAQVLAVIPNNTVVSVLSYGNPWTQVNYGSYYGYVKTSYLTDIRIATPTPAPTAPPVTPTPYGGGTLTARVTTGGGSLNLRQYAGSGASVLAQIPNNTVIAVLSYGSTWSQVVYGALTGYVMTSFLTFTSSPTPTPAPTYAPVATPTAKPFQGETVARVTTSGGPLNLRREASQNSGVITVIPNGSYLQVNGWGAVWSAVFYNGYSGYVMTKYLTAVSSESTVTPAVTAAPVVTATPAPGPTASYDTSVLTRTLRAGYTGNDVILVQQRLYSLNYLSQGNITGVYDDATVSAVKEFQKVHGLSVDGLAGAKTFTLLFSSSAISYSPDVSGYATLHIYYQTVDTTQTSAVQKMQSRLRDLGYTCNVTGIFDETTYMAVISFQLRNGLSVTGAADAATQSRLYASSANGPGAPASLVLEDSAGYIAGPSVSQLNLLHWFNVVKPSLSGGATLLIYDPTTHLSWNLKLMSSGRHADCQPASLRDTLIMFRALGKPSWTIHVVYVQLPDGRWTMATMHDRPHLTGTIADNGFDGHLCVHFLRDMSEVQASDPNYGVNNQNTLRDAWKALTGQTVN